MVLKTRVNNKNYIPYGKLIKEKVITEWGRNTIKIKITNLQYKSF